MKIYKTIRLDDVPEFIRGAYFYDEDGNEKEIENGNFVILGDLVKGERELYEAKAVPTEVQEGTLLNVGVVCTPEFDYNEVGYKGIETFVNNAGRPIRVALLYKGFRFSVTNETPYTLNEVVKVGNKSLKCIAIEKQGRLTYYVMEVQ